MSLWASCIVMLDQAQMISAELIHVCDHWWSARVGLGAAGL